MKNKNNQHGLTFFSAVFLLIIAIVLIDLGIKLIPPYINNYTINGIIKNTVADMQKYDASTPIEEYQQNIRTQFEKNLVVNSIDSVTPQAITVTPLSDGYEIHVNYYVKTHLIGNIDAIIHFNKTTEVVNAQ